MMIIALIGSSCFGGLAAVLGILSLGLGIWAGIALYLGIAMTGILLATIAQLGRQSDRDLRMSRTA